MLQELFTQTRFHKKTVLFIKLRYGNTYTCCLHWPRQINKPSWNSVATSLLSLQCRGRRRLDTAAYLLATDNSAVKLHSKWLHWALTALQILSAIQANVSSCFHVHNKVQITAFDSCSKKWNTAEQYLSHFQIKPLFLNNTNHPASFTACNFFSL